MPRLLSIVILLGLAIVPTSRAAPSAPPPLLAEVRADLTAGLQDMNRAAEAAARAVELATGGEEEVRQILALVATHDPSVVDCGWIDSNGILRWIEPAERRAPEGVDLSAEKVVRQVRQSRQPALGGIARSAEEMDASELAYPVVTAEGRLAGTVRMLFRPGALLERLVGKRTVDPGTEIWILEAGGRILYADDASFVGRSLVTDDCFRTSPELQEIGRRMQKEPDGVAIPPEPAVRALELPSREGWWTSVALHGTAWRILITRAAGTP